MKKSKIWTIVAIISIVFAAYFALNCCVTQSVIGCAIYCVSLIIGTWYEIKETKEQD